MSNARKAARHLLNNDWSRATWKHWLSNIFEPPVEPTNLPAYQQRYQLQLQLQSSASTRRPPPRWVAASSTAAAPS